MLKQTLFFNSPVRLSVKNLQLVISWPDSNDIVTRPIEDIGMVVIEHQMISITMPLINELVRNNVCVVICDEKSMPSSIVMGLSANSTMAESFRKQITMAEPSKKQAWKQIIESKIKNQSLLLDKLHDDGSVLKYYYSNVKSGDSSNREGLAAKIYWQHLFNNEFKRNREGEFPNNLLNYGYAILRAATVRAILGSGLMPLVGLFHKNRYNPFPLADDLMEPFRPYVDEIVYYMAEEGITDLDKEAKSRILRLLFVDVDIGAVTRPLEIALTIMTASLVKYNEGELRKLTLPVFK